MRMQEECKGSERIVTGDGSMMCVSCIVGIYMKVMINK